MELTHRNWLHELMDEYSVFRGGSFDFLVGPSKTRFTLHKALVAPLSEPLAATMSNGMQESQLGFACLDDVDEDTFQRFAEWVYTENYSPAVPCTASVDGGDNEEEKKETISETIQPEAIDYELEVPYEHAFQGKRKRCRKEEPWSGWDRSPPQPRQDRIGRFRVNQVALDQDPKKDYVDFFLCHARLWVFGDQKMIPDLKTLAQGNMRRVLAKFQYYKQRAQDIVVLLDYVYDNTAGPSDKEGMRDIVLEFVTDHIVELASQSVFNDLVRQNSDFAGDLVSRTAQRVSLLQNTVNRW